VQNGTTDQVEKIVKTLNEGQVPPSDVVGTDTKNFYVMPFRTNLEGGRTDPVVVAPT
jgi:hypothetical protein